MCELMFVLLLLLCIDDLYVCRSSPLSSPSSNHPVCCYFDGHKFKNDLQLLTNKMFMKIFITQHREHNLRTQI